MVVLFSHTTAAQNSSNGQVIDSLIMRLSVLDQGEEKADVLYQISEAYSIYDRTRATEYAQLSLNLSKKISYKKGELFASNRLGELKIANGIHVSDGFEYFDRAIKLALAIDDKEMELRVLQNIGHSYQLNKQYNQAVRYYLSAIDLGSATNNSEATTEIYGELGSVLLETGDTTLGLYYFETVLNYETKNEFRHSTPANLISISKYFLLQDNLVMAENFANDAHKKSLEIEDYSLISSSNAYCGNLKIISGNYKQAITHAELGLQTAIDKNLIKEKLENFEVLANAHQQNGDYEEANNFLTQYHALKDSLYETEQGSQRENFETEVDKVTREREQVKTESELRAKDLESENDQLLIYAITIGLLVTFVFLFLLYRRLMKGNKLFKQLEQQQEQLQKLSIVAANIEQMVMIVGNDDRIEWVNSAFEKKFGFLKFEAINRTPYELLGGELTGLKKVTEINERIFKEKLAFEINLTQYAKNKQAFLTRLHISPILKDNGDLDRYIIISHDITEQAKVAEELKELSLVASNTTNSIVIFNADAQVIWVNDSFTEMSGLSADSIIGKSPIDVYNGPLLSEQEKEDLLNSYKSEEPFTAEVESTNRITNSTYWISFNVSPVFSDDGDVIKYISVATDITKIKLLEAQYSDLVEGSTDMIFEINLKGEFIFVNDVMSENLGYSKTELTRMNFVELIPEDHKERVKLFYEKQFKEKELNSYIEFPTKTIDGEILWVGQRARPKIDELTGHISGYSVVTRDISEQKGVEESLSKTHMNASLLSEIGMQITSTHSVTDIINKVYGNINKLMDANVFGIAIPNKEQTRLVFPQVLENGKPLANFGFDMTDNTRLGVICFRESREIIISNFVTQINDYVPDVENVAPVAGDQTISTVYLPLILKGKTIGVITVQSFNEDAYDEYQINLIRSLASFVAIAMENASLYETMEESISKRTKEVSLQKEELEVNYFNTRLLSEIGQLVSSTLDLDEIFDELYERVGQLMDAEMFSVRIYEEEKNTVFYKYSIEKGIRHEPIRISMDEKDNYSVWCIEKRKEVFINDNLQESHKYVSKIMVPSGEMPNSLLFYPMIVENKMIGVITIQSFKMNAYQPYHLDILKTLASYIGTVIDNAELYNTLESKVKLRTEELVQKNNDITASINYAKRLQKGILPDKTFMQQLLPESFVYFKPKDIVSGDFYWVDRTQSKILFAVVDCTGHGVPGAMMSIIGRNLLDQAVNEKGITVPSQILNFLQVGLSLAFGQTGDRKADLFDGMDLALCSIDLKTNILEFSGANNSLYLIQDDELIVLKGDKVGISAEYEISNSYTNTEIEIQKGDVIYLTSDGLPDQFGGERYKKFTYRRMQAMFSDIYTKPMDEQYAFVNEAMTGWKQDHDQTDDICMMGIRIQ
ncbi:MAG: PAS domain S-box protein [Crocinitomix sp.]|nr:PAS domain S-box protein [Crocinitomix sp.]